MRLSEPIKRLPKLAFLPYQFCFSRYQVLYSVEEEDMPGKVLEWLDKEDVPFLVTIPEGDGPLKLWAVEGGGTPRRITGAPDALGRIMADGTEITREEAERLAGAPIDLARVLA